MALTKKQIAEMDDHRLLGGVAEEASEVIKAAMKHQHYGPRPYAGGVQYNNVADLNEEFGQLEELIHEYRGRFGYDGVRHDRKA